MKKEKDIVRVDIRLTKQEAKQVDKAAAAESRSRKNFCETAIKEKAKQIINDGNKEKTSKDTER